MKTHIPVLLNEVLEMAAGGTIPHGVFLDGTFGRGGHSRKLIEKFPDWKILALDCDQGAIEHAKIEFKAWIDQDRFSCVHANYTDIETVLQKHPWTEKNQTLVGALLDLGVSSPQLDEGPRGFSFYHEGPLDMRMDQTQPTSAADIVNSWSEKDLNDLFHFKGEVHSPFRVSKKIIEQRREKKLASTQELSQLIEKVQGWHKKGHHPATNYFLALRLEVNQELERLQAALPRMVKVLRPQGRLLVITFHSLEDRIVKHAFKEMQTRDLGKMVNKKVIPPSRQEVLGNPRSRSAKLRVFEKGAV